MHSKTLFAAGLVVTLAAGTAQAQTVGIGSTKSSIVDAMTTAISTVVSNGSDLRMRRQVMGGTQQYIPVINAGELEFGVSNMIQYAMAVDGRGLSDKPHENLRLVATLMRFRNGFLVKNDSDIRTVADLEGKRVPGGFKGAPLFQAFMTAFLKNGGLTWDDVEVVPAIGLAQSWGLFKQGKIDTAIAGVGGGPNKDMNASIPSGIRYIPFETDTANAKAGLEILRGGAYEHVEPAKPFVAVREPVTVFGYDFTLFTHAGVPDDVVYKVAKALHDGVDDLHAVSAIWKSFSQERMAKDQSVEVHPGAMKFYQEMNLAMKN